jgi:16S rRNA processing protein RimM
VSVTKEPLRVARIDALHGLKGEVSAALVTDFPERFARLRRVRVGRTRDASSRELVGARLHRGKVLLRLGGIDGPAAARALLGCDVWVEPEDVVELPEGGYLQRDLLGLTVRDRSGATLGVVDDILRTGGADVLVVRGGEREMLVPAARSICVEVDLDAGILVVDPPEGLLEINAV